MAKIIIAGNAVVTKSNLTLGDITKIAKYRPNALSLVDENKTEYFRIGVGSSGSISKFGISFADAGAEGKAFVTILAPTGTEDVAKFAEEEIGKAIINLDAVEAKAAEALSSINDELAEIRANISVAQG